MTDATYLKLLALVKKLAAQEQARIDRYHASVIPREHFWRSELDTPETPLIGSTKTARSGGDLGS